MYNIRINKENENETFELQQEDITKTISFDNKCTSTIVLYDSEYKAEEFIRSVISTVSEEDVPNDVEVVYLVDDIKGDMFDNILNIVEENKIKDITTYLFIFSCLTVIKDAYYDVLREINDGCLKTFSLIPSTIIDPATKLTSISYMNRLNDPYAFQYILDLDGDTDNIYLREKPNIF